MYETAGMQYKRRILMKKGTKRLISVFCITAMAVSMTACSGKGEQDGTAGQTQTKESKAAEAKTEAGGTEGKETTGGQQDTEFDPMAKYETSVTITTAVSLDDAMQQMQGVKSDVLTDNNWYKGYLEELGIQVENLWSVPAAQYKEKLNAQISADDLPDVFSVSQEQLKTLVDNGMVMDMTEVFEQYSSDFTDEMMEADDHVALSQCMYDGKLMALPQVSGNHDGVPLMWIRRDWMEKLGKEAPKTVQELEALALAFISEDPDGNGQNDTFGIALAKDLFSNGLCDMTGIMEMFGAHKGWLDINGKAEIGMIQPEMKTALETMASWYQKDIFDKEFVAKDSSKVAEDIIAGKVGITFGQHWTAFWPFPDAKNLNPDADWYPYPIPNAGSEPAKVMVGGSVGQYYAVNVNCKNPEAVVKMFNYYYKKDCALSPDYDSAFHITSSLQIQHPEQSFVWAVMKPGYPQQNLFIHRGLKAYLEGDKSQIENAWVSDNVGQVEGYKEDPVANKAFYGTYIWSGPEGAFSVVDVYEKNNQRLQDLYILGNTDSMAMYNVTLEQLILENYTKIITGENPVSSFDEFVSQWKNLGGDQITQEVNDTLGR